MTPEPRTTCRAPEEPAQLLLAVQAMPSKAQGSAGRSCPCHTLPEILVHEMRSIMKQMSFYAVTLQQITEPQTWSRLGFCQFLVTI